MRNILPYLITAFFMLSFVGLNKKRITDKDFRYEFYTTDARVRVQENTTYYWFKAGAIHNTESGVAGELLDDDFLKYYLDNQLAEAGTFDKGLKKGLWKTWFQNGRLQSTQVWKNGRKDGRCNLYDKTGMLVATGRFNKDRKDGKWIDHVAGETVFFKDGEIYKKKRSKFSVKKRSLEEKKSDSIAKVEKKVAAANAKTKKAEAKARRAVAKAKKEAARKSNAAQKKAAKSNKADKAANSKVKEEGKDKQNFFQKIFKKKDK